MRTVWDYVHLNPVRANLLGIDDRRLELTDGQTGDHHAGEMKRESAEAKAERIIGEELKRLGSTQTDLPQRLKTHPGKLEIAARLHLGTWKSAKTRLKSAKAQRIAMNEQLMF